MVLTNVIVPKTTWLHQSLPFLRVHPSWPLLRPLEQPLPPGSQLKVITTDILFFFQYFHHFQHLFWFAVLCIGDNGNFFAITNFYFQFGQLVLLGYWLCLEIVEINYQQLLVHKLKCVFFWEELSHREKIL